LADVFGPSVEAPVADAREVASVGVLRNHVHMFKHSLKKRPFTSQRSKLVSLNCLVQL
jgi:hypothetical protein